MWTEENANLIMIVMVLGGICIPVGAVFTFAKRKFFEQFRFLVGPRGTVDDEIAGVLRSTGLQLLLLGVLLIAFSVFFAQEQLLPLGIITVIILLIPIIFSIVRHQQNKRRKRAEQEAAQRRRNQPPQA